MGKSLVRWSGPKRERPYGLEGWERDIEIIQIGETAKIRISPGMLFGGWDLHVDPPEGHHRAWDHSGMGSFGYVSPKRAWAAGRTEAWKAAERIACYEDGGHLWDHVERSKADGGDYWKCLACSAYRYTEPKE